MNVSFSTITVAIFALLIVGCGSRDPENLIEKQAPIDRVDIAGVGEVPSKYTITIHTIIETCEQPGRTYWDISDDLIKIRSLKMTPVQTSDCDGKQTVLVGSIKIGSQLTRGVSYKVIVNQTEWGQFVAGEPVDTSTAR